GKRGGRWGVPGPRPRRPGRVRLYRGGGGRAARPWRGPGARAGSGRMIAIDSSVLVDLLADGPQADAAEASLRRCLSVGPVVVCDVVLAEVCSALKDGAEAVAVLEEMGIRFNAI